MGGYRGQGQTRTLRMRTILVNNNNNKRSQCKWGGGRGTNVMLMRSSGTERIFNQLVRNDGNELSNRLVGYWLSYITSITDRNMRPLLRQNIFFFFLIIPWVPIKREEKIPAGIPINIPQPEVTETGASYAHAIWIKSLFLRPTGQWWHKSAPAVGSLNFVNDVLFEMLISLIGPNSRWIWTIQLWLHSVYSIPILNIREVTHINFCMFRLRALAAIYSPMRIIPHVPWWNWISERDAIESSTKAWTGSLGFRSTCWENHSLYNAITHCVNQMTSLCNRGTYQRARWLAGLFWLRYFLFVFLILLFPNQIVRL
jgi:hypothetical protein